MGPGILNIITFRRRINRENGNFPLVPFVSKGIVWLD